MMMTGIKLRFCMFEAKMSGYKNNLDKAIWQKPSAKLKNDEKQSLSIRQKPSGESYGFTLIWLNGLKNLSMKKKLRSLWAVGMNE